MQIPVPPPHGAPPAAAGFADFAVVTDWPAKSSSDPGMHSLVTPVIPVPEPGEPAPGTTDAAVGTTTAAVPAVAEMVPVIDFASSRIPFA